MATKAELELEYANELQKEAEYEDWHAALITPLIRRTRLPIIIADELTSWAVTNDGLTHWHIVFTLQ